MVRLVHALGHHLAEEALGEDVETVGGLVHQQQRGVGGQREAHDDLLLLAHREALEVERGRQFEARQIPLEVAATELGVERRVDAHIIRQADARQVVLLGHYVAVRQHRRPALAHVDPFKTDGAAAGAQQAHHGMEQGRLAHAVLAQQAVDAARLKAKIEVAEYASPGLAVAIREVFNLYHRRFV